MLPLDMAFSAWDVLKYLLADLTCMDINCMASHMDPKIIPCLTVLPAVLTDHYIRSRLRRRPRVRCLRHRRVLRRYLAVRALVVDRNVVTLELVR